MPQEPKNQPAKRGHYEKRLVIRNMTFDEAVTKIARFRMAPKTKTGAKKKGD